LPCEDVVAETLNPEGRIVRLERTTWEHLLRRHPVLEAAADEIMLTIAFPDYREPDPRPGRERYFRRLARFGWLRVVTEFAGQTDRIVTAFPQANHPHERGSTR